MLPFSVESAVKGLREIVSGMLESVKFWIEKGIFTSLGGLDWIWKTGG